MAHPWHLWCQQVLQGTCSASELLQVTIPIRMGWLSPACPLCSLPCPLPAVALPGPRTQPWALYLEGSGSGAQAEPSSPRDATNHGTINL